MPSDDAGLSIEKVCEAIHRCDVDRMSEDLVAGCVLFLQRSMDRIRNNADKTPYDNALLALCRAAIDEGFVLLNARKRDGERGGDVARVASMILPSSHRTQRQDGKE